MTLHENTSRWDRLRAGLKHAFAVSEPLELSDADHALLAKVAGMVARRNLTTPALMVLEMGRPLGWVASQFLHFISPFATAILNKDEYARISQILENRQGVDAVITSVSLAESVQKNVAGAQPREP
jgi:hypothetical protein